MRSSPLHRGRFGRAAHRHDRRDSTPRTRKSPSSTPCWRTPKPSARTWKTSCPPPRRCASDTQAQLTEEQDRANALDASLTKAEEVLADTQAQLTEEQDRANALDASLTKVEEVLADTQAQLTAAQAQASDLADQLCHPCRTQYGALEESSSDADGESGGSHL